MRARKGFGSLIFYVIFFVTTVAAVRADIQGRVTDESGAAVTSLHVYLNSDSGDSHVAMTDAEGNYSDAASPGSWTIRFDSEELKQRRLAAIQRTQIVSVAEGVTTYDIHLLRTPYDIHVRLVDENGELYQTGAPDFYVQSMIVGGGFPLQGGL